MAALIREAVDRVVPDDASPSADERWDRAFAAMGSATAGVTDASVEHDRYLAEASADE